MLLSCRKETQFVPACVASADVKSVPAESQIQQIMGTLRWGISTNDLDVALPSLEALAALARFHANAVAAGAHGVPRLSGIYLGIILGYPIWLSMQV